MANTLNGIIALFPSLVRLAHGASVKGHRKSPEKMLVLYDAEYCPYCRYVREVLTELDLDALIYPRPKGGERFRQQQMDLNEGKSSVPFLVDENTNRKIAGSQEIADYLYAEYGPLNSKPHARLVYLSLVATLIRFGKGMNVSPSNAPAQPLELYSFEGSPFSRLVRETMCELEIPYVLHNVGKAPGKLIEWLPPGLRASMTKYQPLTENRQKLFERTGRVQMPYLVDPNTQTSLFESADIQRYLRNTYAKG